MNGSTRVPDAGCGPSAAQGPPWLPDASTTPVPPRRPGRGPRIWPAPGRAPAASVHRGQRAACGHQSGGTPPPPGRPPRPAAAAPSVHILPDMPERDAYDALPKVELHCHVEGAIRPRTVVELARKNGRELPTDDPTELYRYHSLDSFLEIFWLVQSLLVEPDDWERAAHESLVDAAAHGLRYREMFFTPARHLAAGQRLPDI